MIYLESKHKDCVMDILKKYPYKFYAFGSRVSGDYKKFSDLDLCYMDNIPINELVCLEDDFENSDLPFKVDLVNWNLCDENFRNNIKKTLRIISDTSRTP